MQRIKSPGQAQRFLSFHGVMNNLFRQQRHPLSVRRMAANGRSGSSRC